MAHRSHIRIPVVGRALSPVGSDFVPVEALGGILLLVATIAALVWANIAGVSYADVWGHELTIGWGTFSISEDLLHWVNDGLMTIFFFVVGLEIKREVLVGELASPRQAALSVAAAVGGMLVPAALYAALNMGGPGAAGWGIPMATDIAFALGVLALLGSRVPLSLKIFLTAIAIVDDLGAVLVIAFFYTAELSWLALALVGVVMAALVALNLMRVRSPLPYVLLGIVLWVAMLKSGVHATLAGILLAMTIPARRRIDAPEFLRRAELYLAEFAEDVQPGRSEPTGDQRHALHSLEAAAEHVATPLLRLEHTLHPWVAFMIMPVFALANAGVPLGGDVAGVLRSPVTLGIILGLFLGKQIGILAFAWLAVRSRLAVLPAGVGWSQIWGVSLLCGIGFTMSLFIASLAFADAALLAAAKIGILAASVLAGAAGALVLVRVSRADGIGGAP